MNIENIEIDKILEVKIGDMVIYKDPSLESEDDLEREVPRTKDI